MKNGIESFEFACLATFFSLLICIFSSCDCAATAAPQQFEQAVKAYSSGQYASALSQFQQLARTAPNNTQVHYYMGLCYQCLNQVALAKQEYQWVAGRDAQLRQYCLDALSRLDKYQTGRQTSYQSSTTAPGATQTGGQSISGRLRIYDFYTEWCGWCKKFKPHWEEAKGRLSSRAEFKSIDCEDDSNSSLVEKYDVHSYPQIIFTDNTGRVLKRHKGAYMSTADFVEDINSFLNP